MTCQPGERFCKMKKRAFCILLALAIFILAGCTIIRRDRDADAFIDTYLSSYAYLVEYLTEDYNRHCEEANGEYIIDDDYKNHTIRSLIRCGEDTDSEIIDRELIKALEFVRGATTYPLCDILLTDERITFLSSEGMGGIVYMRSDKKPSYFISADEKRANYSMYEICDHWYQVVMRLR